MTFTKSRFLDKAQLLKQKAVVGPPLSSTSKENEKTNHNMGILTYEADKRATTDGEKSVISHLAENNPKVLDVYVTFTVETPLLSERQRHELNPLIIRINLAACLPNTPVPIEVPQGQ
ncbi:uncharacterized protein LJ206_013956 isoform 1-T1 [Theristicus caerulescens]